MSSPVSMPVTLREMEPEDVPAMAALEALVSPEPWSYELFAGELTVNAAERHWLVAIDGDGTLVGFGGLMFVGVGDEPFEAHLMNIATAPDQQRRAVASRLLHGLLVEARIRVTGSLTLEVRTDNEPAKALYRRFGLSDEGIRPGYYSDGADALIMWARGIMTDGYGARIAELVPELHEGEAMKSERTDS